MGRKRCVMKVSGFGFQEEKVKEKTYMAVGDFDVYRKLCQLHPVYGAIEEVRIAEDLPERSGTLSGVYPHVERVGEDAGEKTAG